MGKKKTHEQYIYEVAEINSNIIVVGTYINASTKILHKCKIDGNEWMAEPNRILSGHGCKICGITKQTKARTKTHEQFIVECTQKHPNIEILGKYVNAHTRILCHCKIDGYEWSPEAQSLLSGTGCPMCAGIVPYTTETFVAKLVQINPDIEVIGQYISGKEHIKCRCKIDNYIWNPIAHNLLQGQRCPKCTNHIWYTHEEYVDMLARVNPAIEVKGQYVDMKIPILHYCTIHDVLWNAIPDGLLRGGGCRQCGLEKIRQKQTKKHEQYVIDLAQKNPNVEVIGEYTNSKTPLLHRCKIHNIFWSPRPHNVLNGKGCPECLSERISASLKNDTEWYVNRLNEISSTFMPIEEYLGYGTPILHKCSIDGYEGPAKPCNVLRGFACPKCSGYSGERLISQFLDEHNVKYVPQYRFDDCKDKRQLPFDFYLPELHKAIEFDGRQHYESVDWAGKGDEWAEEQLHIVQQHDAIKTQYCKDKNIPLLRIPYFKDIEEELTKFLFI